MRVGELSKIPSKGVEQKRGEGKQRFSKGRGGQLGQGVGALKRGGLEPSLRTMNSTSVKLYFKIMQQETNYNLQASYKLLTTYAKGSNKFIVYLLI